MTRDTKRTIPELESPGISTKSVVSEGGLNAPTLFPGVIIPIVPGRYDIKVGPQLEAF